MNAGKPRTFWNEDWVAVAIGLAMFCAALAGFGRFDTFGWAAKTSVWTNIVKIVTPASATVAYLPGVLSLLLTFLFLVVLLIAGLAQLGVPKTRFAAAFTVVFFCSYLCF